MRYLCLFLVLCSLPLYAAQHSAVIAQAHKTAHHTESSTLFSSSACSATAIGRNALLTASHCEKPTDDIEVDGEHHVIEGILRDGNDHTIYLLSGPVFTDVASFSTDAIAVGDDVFIFGNPTGFADVFRRGTIANTQVKPTGIAAAFDNGPAKFLVDMNIYYGDSGAALFDADGKIVGVVSALTVQHSEDASIKFMGCVVLAFTKEQIEQATSFFPKDTPSPTKDSTIE